MEPLLAALLGALAVVLAWWRWTVSRATPPRPAPLPPHTAEHPLPSPDAVEDALGAAEDWQARYDEHETTDPGAPPPPVRPAPWRDALEQWGDGPGDAEPERRPQGGLDDPKR